MELETIRLECIKLVHRHDLQAVDLVERAKVFEQYILAPEPKKPAVTSTAKEKAKAP